MVSSKRQTSHAKRPSLALHPLAALHAVIRLRVTFWAALLANILIGAGVGVQIVIVCDEFAAFVTVVGIVKFHFSHPHSSATLAGVSISSIANCAVIT